MRNLMRAAVLSGSLLVVLAGPAQGATTIGSDLAADPTVGSCGPDPCTFVQRALTGRQLTAPADGVIVRWRIKPGGFPASTQASLRVVRGTGAACTGVAGAIDSELLVSAFAVNTFDARIPIAAGDAIGLDCCNAPIVFAHGATTGATNDDWTPKLNDGETRAPSHSETDTEFLFNADIEADADGDGFGDETQDQCATDATTQGPCAGGPVPPDTDPPETMILKKPKDTHKSTFKYPFESFELNTTFDCKLKGKGLKASVKQYAPCTSPKKYKNLDPGRYKFFVYATDAAGNADPTPDTDKFKILE
jgi:hypothetical protein